MAVILTIIGIIIGVLAGAVWACIYCGKDYRMTSLQKSEKSMLEYWINRNQNEGRNMSLFFVNNDYYNIAIYGASGIYYDSFVQNTKMRCFQNVYLADRRAAELSEEKDQKVYTKEELKTLDLDAVVITSDIHFEEIKEELDALELDADIFSYRDLVYNLRKEKLE